MQQFESLLGEIVAILVQRNGRFCRVKESMKIIFAAAMTLSLVGCITVPVDQMPITTEKRDFVYDYAVPGKTQAELYRSARNYLALNYGDSRAVARIEDEAQGTIIGQGNAPWNLSIDGAFGMKIPCSSKYEIIFLAKDGRARLQLGIKEGVVLPASCGWALPPKRDYPQIPPQFDLISKGLEDALRGSSKLESLKNF